MLSRIFLRSPRIRSITRRHLHDESGEEAKVQICVVGSGPAGFYTAQYLLKNPKICVDIYDRLPVPFGLVRYGVAPDHPEVKNVINTFSATARKKNCSFIGNVNIGTDVVVGDLQKAYHAVVLCYGADEDRTLGIPGEDLPNVFPARRFVGWYNGLEKDSQLNPNLDIEDVVIVGQGNVALDVARILLLPIEKMKLTDVPQPVLECLSNSRVKSVHLVGRRGPLQAAFTIKELREMIGLHGCRPILRKDDFKPYENKTADLPRVRKRLTELMVKTALGDPTPQQTERWKNASRYWHLRFLRSPIEILGGASDSSSVTSIRLTSNRLEGTGDEAKAIATCQTEDIPCGMVLRSVGYRSLPIDCNVPFDHKRGLIPNDGSRVRGTKGLYCSGWVQSGPVGVIASTMNGGFATGADILKDIEDGVLPVAKSLPGKAEILETLHKKGIQTVNFSDWDKIDAVEKKMGSKLGKPREKILSVGEMLKIAAS